jgi:hypothetical protein
VLANAERVGVPAWPWRGGDYSTLD